MTGHCSLNFTLEADGSVFPCDFYTGDDSLFGNIFDKDFSELEQCEKARKFLQKSLEASPGCKACKYYFMTLGSKANSDT